MKCNEEEDKESRVGEVRNLIRVVKIILLIYFF